MGKASKTKRERRAFVPSVRLEDRTIELLKKSIESQLKGDTVAVSVYSLAALGWEVKVRSQVTKRPVDVERALHDLEWVATGILNGVLEERKVTIDSGQGVGYNSTETTNGEEVRDSEQTTSGDSGQSNARDGDPILDPTPSGSLNGPATDGGADTSTHT